MMSFSAIAMLPCLLASAMMQQTAVDHLTPQEVAAAVALPPNSGFTQIVDQSLNAVNCSIQKPSEAVFTPAGWINAQAQLQKRQFLPYNPAEADTFRVLTVSSKGCVQDTPTGLVCPPITRVVLASDKDGVLVAEALATESTSQTWTDAAGFTANCAGLTAKFSMSDLQKIRNSKGEFTIATFSGTTPLKAYVVKDKYLKKLGL